MAYAVNETLPSGAGALLKIPVRTAVTDFHDCSLPVAYAPSVGRTALVCIGTFHFVRYARTFSNIRVVYATLKYFHIQQ
jgi:hypothetical protein